MVDGTFRSAKRSESTDDPIGWFLIGAGGPWVITSRSLGGPGRLPVGLQEALSDYQSVFKAACAITSRSLRGAGRLPVGPQEALTPERFGL